MCSERIRPGAVERRACELARIVEQVAQLRVPVAGDLACRQSEPLGEQQAFEGTLVSPADVAQIGHVLAGQELPGGGAQAGALAVRAGHGNAGGQRGAGERPEQLVHGNGQDLTIGIRAGVGDLEAGKRRADILGTGEDRLALSELRTDLVGPPP